MVAQQQTRTTASILVDTARQAGLEFEASPSGQWLRVGLTTGAFYLVQEPFAPGCSLLETASGLSRRVHYFPDVAEAVAALKDHLQAKVAESSHVAGDSFWLR